MKRSNACSVSGGKGSALAMMFGMGTKKEVDDGSGIKEGCPQLLYTLICSWLPCNVLKSLELELVRLAV